MRYLAIDRIIAKDNWAQSNGRISKVLKKVISDRNKLSAEESQKIDELEKDIIKENVFRLVSVRTPIEEFTPVKFNMVFDYENLNDTETVDLTVSHILLRNYYLMQFPLGHHCEIIANCESGKPKLFEKLMTDEYDSIKIGFCNQSDWEDIKRQLMESKVEFEKWKAKNIKKS